MQTLKDLLSRYAHVGVSEQKKKKLVKEVLEKALSIVIPEYAVKIVDTVVVLQVPSTIRYVVHEQKNNLLQEISEKLGNKKEITDIR